VSMGMAHLRAWFCSTPVRNPCKVQPEQS
jgi:hypothetical protein